MLGTEPLYTAEQTRALDRCAIEEHAVPGHVLMARAAEAAFGCLREHWPHNQSLQVFCGTGNNGGDGYLIADLAHKRGLAVTVYQVGDAARIRGDAKLAREQALANGVACVGFDAFQAAKDGVIVDALLGTGQSGAVRGEYREVIAAINQSAVPVLAVDIPSGLCADTGRALGCAVVADLTVTFIGLKRGLFTLDAQDHTGVVQFCDLAVPMEIYATVPAKCHRLELETLLPLLPERSASAHKGSFGAVLVVGGDHGMAGAALMAAEAALRCGAGLVRVATRAEHVAAYASRVPEVMATGVVGAGPLEPLLQASGVLVIGPGLGQSEWAQELLAAALACGKPAVVDADALNLLAGSGALKDAELPPDCILTPHPGEAARLLNSTGSDVQQDRFAAAQALQTATGAVVVLKGNGSLIAGADELLLSDYGNPGMASGGMGDVLSGVLGALLAQGLAPLEAAALGVSLHGAAADIAAQDGQAGLLATDLLPILRRLLG